MSSWCSWCNNRFALQLQIHLFLFQNLCLSLSSTESQHRAGTWATAFIVLAIGDISQNWDLQMQKVQHWNFSCALVLICLPWALPLPKDYASYCVHSYELHLHVCTIAKFLNFFVVGRLNIKKMHCLQIGLSFL